MSIYVEIRIHAPMEALWAHTQTPSLHEKWDLRFSSIDYIPKRCSGAPQRFRYATRIGFGIEVSGEGETVGQGNLPDGSCSSALKFVSTETLSLISEGSGYWKYIPTAEGIRFLTWYDYRTRFGSAGALFDRLIFRPLIGWATAWSFDRLRLWLEHRIDPGLAMRQALMHIIARVALAAVFTYQGLVPKLIVRHSDEIAMLAEAGVAPDAAYIGLTSLGVAEIVLAAALVIAWRQRWPLAVCIACMAAATAVVGVHSPRFFEAAFNPLTLNLAVASLATIDLVVLASVPTAAHCLRRRPSGDL